MSFLCIPRGEAWRWNLHPLFLSKAPPSFTGMVGVRFVCIARTALLGHWDCSVCGCHLFYLCIASALSRSHCAISTICHQKCPQASVKCFLLDFLSCVLIHRGITIWQYYQYPHTLLVLFTSNTEKNVIKLFKTNVILLTTRKTSPAINCIQHLNDQKCGQMLWIFHSP